ncbi:MAG: glycoside hydrolase family 2 TIM barrel-domain containing protein [Candidatus Omnitrophota bacterium]
MRKILIILVFLFIGLNVASLSWADILYVYRDGGTPNVWKLWTWDGGGGFSEQRFSQETPEGVSYFATVSNNWAGWGIFFNDDQNYTLDLSRYNGGHLKFFVKTPVDLKVEIEAPQGVNRTKYISDYGWDLVNQWQEIVIPLSDFSADLSHTYCPFKITVESSQVFFVDHVRWEVPINGNPTAVSVNGRKLFVDGKVFAIQGVNAEFTPIGEYGSSYDWSLSQDDYINDISLMKEMGVNTIRTYSIRPSQKAALDSLYQNDIYVVMGFPVVAKYSGQAVDFGNPVVRENIKARFREMVRHWKNHPAILMWSLGNEVNRELEGAGVNPSDWYSLVNECAQAAHLEEGANYHPVTTANADQADWDIGDPLKNADDASLSYLDVWSMQFYRGESFGSVFDDFAALTNKPLLISEFGCDAYDGRFGHEDQTIQAEYLESLWPEIWSNIANLGNSKVGIGGIAFSWKDGWYKSSHGTPSSHDTVVDWYNPGYLDPNMNEEWWGLVSTDTSTTRQGYNVLKDKFSYILGDANRMENIDLDDVVYLIAYIFVGGPQPLPYKIGDVECSGSIDLDDVVYLIAYIFTGGPAPMVCEKNTKLNRSGDDLNPKGDYDNLEEFLSAYPELRREFPKAVGPVNKSADLMMK